MSSSFSVGQSVRLRHVGRAIRPVSQPTSVLDAGCGGGVLSRRLARRYASMQVVGVDDDAELIDRCIRRHGQRQPNLTFRHHELGGSHLGEEFDLVLCADVMEHIADDQGSIEWLAAHLRPGGKLVLHVPAAHQRHVFSLLDQHMLAEVASGTGPHVREGYEPHRLQCMARLAGLRVSRLGYTFHNPITRVAVDTEQWASISGRRYLKVPLLPALLAAAFCEQRISSSRTGHGLLMVATKSSNNNFS